MSIVTGTGDRGMTGLCCGGTVAKDDLRMEACGDIDELCASLGFARSILRRRKDKEVLASIQEDLFLIGAEVTTRVGSAGSRRARRIGDEHVERLESLIRLLERRVPAPKFFVIPGATTSSAALDVARAVARRAERSVVRLVRRRLVRRSRAIVYLNRLSDLLYLMARREGKTR